MIMLFTWHGRQCARWTTRRSWMWVCHWSFYLAVIFLFFSSGNVFESLFSVFRLPWNLRRLRCSQLMSFMALWETTWNDHLTSKRFYFYSFQAHRIRESTEMKVIASRIHEFATSPRKHKIRNLKTPTGCGHDHQLTSFKVALKKYQCEFCSFFFFWSVFTFVLI